MNDLARTHLRQARGFLSAGNPSKAAELLENAKVLARDDRDLLAEIYSDLARAADASGNMEQAARARDMLARMSDGRPAPQTMGAATMAMPMAGAPMQAVVIRGGHRAWPWIAGIAAAFVLAGGLTVFAVLQTRKPAQTVTPASSSTDRNQQAKAATRNSGGTTPATQPSNGTVNPAANPGALFPGATQKSQVEGNIGLVVALARYEGLAGGRRSVAELPVSAGTAFAITADGFMLTNRRVVEVQPNSGAVNAPPPTLAVLGASTMVFRTSTLLVCFGPDAKDRVPAEVVGLSSNFDLAVLKVNRTFAHPLSISRRRTRQADDVALWGMPSSQAHLFAASLPQSRLDEFAKNIRVMTASPLDAFPASAFMPAAVKGIVTAPERHIKGAAYLQVDATVTPGNTGGPMIGGHGEVIGIAELGVKPETSDPLSRASYGLSVDQLSDEVVASVNAWKQARGQP